MLGNQLFTAIYRAGPAMSELESSDLMGTSINSEPPKGTAMKTITYGAIIDHLWY